MPEFDMEAFVKYGNVSEAESSVTALVKNREGSRHVTVADALSCELTVYLYARIDDEGTTEETSLQFFRDIADIAPGSDWEHTWTITGVVHYAFVDVRDSAGEKLAHASAGM